jgi:nucleoside-diphosphate-sugar epimerase
MNRFLIQIAILLAAIIPTRAQTAVIFGASGAVGSEILQSLLNGSSFEEVILIQRKSSPKVDEILSQKKIGAPKVTPVQLADLNDIASYDNLKSADACFIAIGVGHINEVTLQYWHSVEVDLVRSMTQFCDKIQVRTLTLLSAVDVMYESVTPFSKEEVHAENQKPLGWVKALDLYYRMKGLEEKAVIQAAKHIEHIRLFQPSTIVTKENRYGWVDRIMFAFQNLFDPYLPEKYHSVDVKLLGLAMVADAEGILQSSSIENESGVEIAKLTYSDFLSVAGDAFVERHQTKSDEL